MKKETTVRFRHLCSRLVLVGILLAPVIACESKGKIYGNISSVISDKPVIEGTRAKRVKEMGVVKNKEVLLLKYTNALPTKHQQLFEECSNRYAKLSKEYHKDIAEQLSSEGGRLSMILMMGFNEAANNLYRECGNRRNNLIFVDIINKTTSGDDGIYEFTQIPYGKYFISVQLGNFWWLVPVYLNDKEVRLELNDKNSFEISGEL